jgi:NAD(P)H-dependent flavin oxidoreductase YrpB (nitropropane dioxygenase family)
MLTTPLCHQLGIAYPIFSAGMGVGMAGPALTAAVSNAGGCGVLGMGGLPAPYIRQQIQHVRALTQKPFGVNLLLPLLQEGQFDACLDEAIPLLVLFWGDPTPYVQEAHRHGTRVFIQVGSVAEAKAAVGAGVDAIIAQGMEAGGHVRSTIALSTLVPAVVEAVKPVPVIAAGGIANGRGVVAALGLGAQAVSMGTRFVASEEAHVHRGYKARIVQSTAEETVYTRLFDVEWPDAAHRVLWNTVIEEWAAAGGPASGQRPGEGTVIGTMPVAGTSVEVVKYSSFPPLPGFIGDIEATALYAGESCSLVNDIKPAAQIVRDVVREAEEVIEGMTRRLRARPPAMYQKATEG